MSEKTSQENIEAIIRQLDKKPLEQGKEYPYLSFRQDQPVLYVTSYYEKKNSMGEAHDVDFIQFSQSVMEELIQKALVSETRESSISAAGSWYVHKEIWHAPTYRYAGGPAKTLDININLHLKLVNDEPEFALKLNDKPDKC
jgi:hypothetical protein